jgi:hypothetical protein
VDVGVVLAVMLSRIELLEDSDTVDLETVFADDLAVIHAIDRDCTVSHSSLSFD